MIVSTIRDNGHYRMDGSGSDGHSRREGGGRQFWSAEEKRQIVAESYETGASVSQVARRRGLNANLLFTWRRQFRRPEAETKAKVELLPVSVVPEKEEAVLAEVQRPAGSDGRMEIILSSGHRIVVDADVDGAALKRVIEALSRR